MTKLTKRFVDAVEPQNKSHVIWDDELPCFGLRIYPSRKRSYLVELAPVSTGHFGIAMEAWAYA